MAVNPSSQSNVGSSSSSSSSSSGAQTAANHSSTSPSSIPSSSTSTPKLKKHHHEFKRLFLGPMPVPSTSAAALIANAIQQDSTLQDPKTAGLAAVDSRLGRLVVLDRGRVKVKTQIKHEKETGGNGEIKNITDFLQSDSLVNKKGPDAAPMAWASGDDSEGNKVAQIDGEEKTNRDDVVDNSSSPPPPPPIEINSSDSNSTIINQALLPPLSPKSTPSHLKSKSESSAEDQSSNHNTPRRVSMLEPPNQQSSSTPPFSKSNPKSMDKSISSKQKRGMKRDPSTNSVNSNISFISATSMPESILSEADISHRLNNSGGQNEEEENEEINHEIPRKWKPNSSSTVGNPIMKRRSGSEFGTQSTTPSASPNKSNSRISFDDQKPRRNSSESSVLNQNSSSGFKIPLPLLDLPVEEDDESEMGLENGADEGESGLPTLDSGSTISPSTPSKRSSIHEKARSHDDSLLRTPRSTRTNRQLSPRDSSPLRNSVTSNQMDELVSIAPLEESNPTSDPPSSSSTSDVLQSSPSSSKPKKNKNSNSSFKVGGMNGSRDGINNLTREKGREYSRRSIGASDAGKNLDEQEEDQGNENETDLNPTGSLHPHFNNVENQRTKVEDQTNDSIPMSSKDRARSKFLSSTSNIHGHGGHSKNYSEFGSKEIHSKDQHIRDFSRASRHSRISRVSTVGTLGSVATKDTEDSFGFGATGGVRARMKQVLSNLGGSQKEKEKEKQRELRNNRLEMMNKGDEISRSRDTTQKDLSGNQHQQSIRNQRSSSKIRSPSFTSNQIGRTSSRNLRQNSSFSKGRRSNTLLGSSRTLMEDSLPPGSMGVSSGGTKWVGGSFEVGQRFWQILNSRSEELTRESEEEKKRLEDERLAKERVEEEKEKERQDEIDEKTRVATKKNSKVFNEEANELINHSRRARLSNIDTKFNGDSQSHSRKDRSTSEFSMSKSPSDVLSTFRNQANETAGERHLEAIANGQVVHGPDAIIDDKEEFRSEEMERVVRNSKFVGNDKNEDEQLQSREIGNLPTRESSDTVKPQLITQLGSHENSTASSPSPKGKGKEPIPSPFDSSTASTKQPVPPSTTDSTRKEPSTKATGDNIESRINWTDVVGFLNTHNHQTKPVLPPIKSVINSNAKKNKQKEVEKKSTSPTSSPAKEQHGNGVTGWGMRAFETSIEGIKGWGSIGGSSKGKEKDQLKESLRESEVDQEEEIRPELIRFETAKEVVDGQEQDELEDGDETGSIIEHSTDEEESIVNQDQKDSQPEATSTYASVSTGTQSTTSQSQVGGGGGTSLKTMTMKEALNHPDPPIEAEAKYPELTLSWLRRGSDLEDEVANLAARRASEPYDVISESPTQFSSPGDSQSLAGVGRHGKSTLRELTASGTQDILEEGEEKEKKIDGNHLLIPKFSAPSLSGNSKSSKNSQKPIFSSISKANGGTQRKKVVQFEGSTEAETKLQMRNLFQRSSTFPNIGSADTPSPVSRIASGDESPRPPEEVLSRPDDSLHGQDLSTVSADANVTSSPFGSTPNTPNEMRLVAQNTGEPITRKSVLKRDRMLVKIEWTASEDLPPDFNELNARKYATYVDKWREYMVVMRMGRLELWDDPTFTSKALGRPNRLKLRYIVPLRKGRTDLSIYSSIDRIFCLTFQSGGANHLGEQGHKGMPHLRRSGTNIMIFDCRSRSVAADWIWELWRELGGTIPEALEVHVPVFDLRVRVPIPDQIPVDEEPSYLSGISLMPTSDSNSESSKMIGEGFKLINRDNIVQTFTRLIASVPNWRDLMKSAQREGLDFELAWRRGTTLDWITEHTTVDGQARGWAVISGMILKSIKHPSILELRTATHYPTDVRLSSGAKIQEPPAIEGFLWRVKPVSGALTRVYITTHDGHIFVNRPSRAFPPDRHLATLAQSNLDSSRDVMDGTAHLASNSNRVQQPGQQPRGSVLGRVFNSKKVNKDESFANLRQQVTETITTTATTPEEVAAQVEAYEAFEKRRQFEQINGSDGYVDLRDIFMIRCVGKGPIRRPSLDGSARRDGPCRKPARLRPEVKADEEAAQREDEETDDEEEIEEDLGGEGGLANSKDRNATRLSRQLEIIMVNGKSVRLEAYSASVAREWIEALGALSVYWKRREKVDAQQLMDAAGFESVHLQRRLKSGQVPKPLGQGIESEEISHALGSLWNWCTIEGCRGIIKSGSLFHKKKAYTAFQHRYYVLIAGRLLCFKLLTKVSTARARQNARIFHQKQETVVNLRDAYVYSGKLTEAMLSNGRSEGAQTSNNLGGGSGGLGSSERHKLPRVYRDGLLSIDEDEECTLVVRYRPQRVNKAGDPNLLSTTINNNNNDDTSSTSQTIPTLKDKAHKFLVLRARSRMERDLWVRALSLEIERIVREDKEREDSLRNSGQVPFK